MKKSLQYFRESFLSLVLSSRQTAIAYHSDSDGVATTKILMDYLLSKGKKLEQYSFFPVNNSLRHLTKDQEREVLSKNPDLLLYLDLGNNSFKEVDHLRTKIKSVASVDHHGFPEGFGDHFTLYVNSAHIQGLNDPARLCAARLMGLLVQSTESSWIEMIGLEGDSVIPSIPNTPSWEAHQILNLLGLTWRDDEGEEGRISRSNRLLHLFLSSVNVFDFIKKFNAQTDLKKIYDQMQADIHENIQKLIENNVPSQQLENGSVIVHRVEGKSGFDIVDTVLKAHFPHRRENATYLYVQSLQDKRRTKIFVATKHPNVNCYEVCKSGGGGGHHNRAGNVYMGDDLEGEIARLTAMIGSMMLQQAEA